MDEDDLITLLNDRIRALEIIVQVMTTAVDVMQGNVMNELREIIDHRLVEMGAAEHLPGQGASRRSLELAREILGEALTRPRQGAVDD